MEGHRARARAAAHGGGVIFHIAHALDAAGYDQVGGAGLDHHGCSGDGLQAAAAAPVELHAGNLDRQAGRQGRPATHAGRLAVGVALGEHHIVDPQRVDPRAFDQGLDHGGGQLGRRDAGEGAQELADRGAERCDDGGASHGGSSMFSALAVWI